MHEFLKPELALGSVISILPSGSQSRGQFTWTSSLEQTYTSRLFTANVRRTFRFLIVSYPIVERFCSNPPNSHLQKACSDTESMQRTGVRLNMFVRSKVTQKATSRPPSRRRRR